MLGFLGIAASSVAITSGLILLQPRVTPLRVALIGILAVMVCYCLALVLVQKLLNPIRSLLVATQRIAAGDIDRHIPVDREDVVGSLARSFNRMALRIRRQQRALAAANRQLGANVRLRTAQLEAANKRLSSEIAEKEDFLRAISHDLNAPLRNIAGMAAMLLRDPEALNAEAIHRLQRIQKNVEVQTNLIGELLELSQIKTHRLRMEQIDIRAVVEEVAGTFEADFRQRDIRFVIDGPLPQLRCERVRIRQVFQNLIDNSVKYMGDHAGPREIHVGCAIRPDEAEFYVRDDGIGMDVKDRKLLFHVFRRGSNARAAGIPGKGVGLASVKSIIETYSGSIWAQSTLGSGTTFYFTINGEFVIHPSPARAA